MPVIYEFIEKEHKQGRSLAGVPLRDLTEADIASYPDHVVKSIEACALYRKKAKPAAVVGATVAEVEEKDGGNSAESEQPKSTRRRRKSAEGGA